jgi:hypothetical protein
MILRMKINHFLKLIKKIKLVHKILNDIYLNIQHIFKNKKDQVL